MAFAQAPQAAALLRALEPLAALRRAAAPLPPLVLASASPFRLAVLEAAGVTPAAVVKPDIDEKAIRRDTPRELVQALAHAKADAALAKAEVSLGAGRYAELAAQGAVLVAADQVVCCGTSLLEKPRDEHEARAMIARHPTEPPSTVGALVASPLAASEASPRAAGVSIATIHFEPLPDDSVDKLIALGGVYHCAGGLMCEHPLVFPHVTKLEGGLDGIMGLDTALLAELLDQLES